MLLLLATTSEPPFTLVDPEKGVRIRQRQYAQTVFDQVRSSDRSGDRVVAEVHVDCPAAQCDRAVTAQRDSAARGKLQRSAVQRHAAARAAQGGCCY